jgi:hypothetical protein
MGYRSVALVAAAMLCGLVVPASAFAGSSSDRSGPAPALVEAASSRSSAPPAERAGIRKLNADDAEAEQKEYASWKPDMPCEPDQQAVINDQFAQCGEDKKFQLTSCAAGLKAVVLPLVRKRGTSITCDTEEDRQAKLDQARNNT